MAEFDISPELLAALHRLSALLDEENALEKTLQTVVDLSVATLPGCDAAGVTLRIKGKDRTAAASDSYTLSIDNLQYEAGEGPCVESLERGERVRIEDISQETRWSEFTRRAAEHSLRSSLSHPLHQNGSVGALNLYAKTVHAFDDRAAAVAEIFAKQASIALHNARTYMAGRVLAEQLVEALQSRDVIGQAKGILMERRGITGDEAFEILSTASQKHNLKVRDVAQRLVEGKPVSARVDESGPRA
jgi:GAF domain-containing protein